jgi:hypothetical protein
VDAGALGDEAADGRALGDEAADGRALGDEAADGRALGDEAADTGATADEEGAGVAVVAGRLDAPVDGFAADGAGMPVCPVPEITLPMEVPVPDLPQTTDESGFPTAASAPVTQVMTKTKAPMASKPYTSHARSRPEMRRGRDEPAAFLAGPRVPRPPA